MTQSHKPLQLRLWNPYIIVFVSSACVMIIELVASRIIAPQVGVSLYTWTSVIGVILAGMSLGNYLGGRLADRFGSLRLLGTLFAVAAILCLLIFPLRTLINTVRWSPGFPLMLRVVLYITAIFLLPSVALGCISPVVIKLSLQDLQRTGTTVGKISAWSTAGSIIGTFATGFWLISLFGTKTIVVLVSSLLMLMAVWFLASVSAKKTFPAVIAACLLFGGILAVLLWRGELGSECQNETNYFCINTYDRVHEYTDTVNGIDKPVTTEVRVLVLDRLVHNYVDLKNPARLVYGYERTYADIIQPLLQRKGQLDALFIGGGGYTFPRYLESLSPESRLVVAEIDPGVTETAYDRLGLPRDTRIQTFNLDARILMQTQLRGEKYDLVFGDAFNDYSVPYHLTTREFDQLINDMLRDDGMYVANIIDGGRHGHFLRAFVRTVQQVFPYVAVIPSSQAWQETYRNTFVIAASRQPIDLSALRGSYTALSPEALAAYLALEEPLVLTDEYVPVDNLLAPVYIDSERT